MRPDKAQAARLALESGQAEKVWKAVGKATGSFGVVVDENFYSWVDAEVAVLATNRRNASGDVASEMGSFADTGTTTWTQPPRYRSEQ